jgi:hypothetical protein
MKPGFARRKAAAVQISEEGAGEMPDASHPPVTGGGECPYCSLTTTFVRSIWLRRLTVKLSLMESCSRFGYVYQ